MSTHLSRSTSVPASRIETLRGKVALVTGAGMSMSLSLSSPSTLLHSTRQSQLNLLLSIYKINLIHTHATI